MEKKCVQQKVQALRQQLKALGEELGSQFSRAEARTTVARYLQGLLSRVERKNSWQLAEQVGNATPYA